MLCTVLVVTFLIRAWRTDQPIVENYVGRQIPTAMVARNLERGSGFLWPELDTAPFPSYFVVEPPLYQLLVVNLRRPTGLTLEAAGRIVSALAMTLGAWGLFTLVRKRRGERAALLAILAFAIMPLTIRYGRAFQPDALMLGTVLAGLACCDRSASHDSRSWLGAGLCLLAFGIAVKVIAAFVLVPCCLANPRLRRARILAALAATLVPALAWYAWAYHLIEFGGGSRASADNRSIWLQLAGPIALFKRETLLWVARFLLVRAFTPVGAALAIIGFWRGRDANDRLFQFWGISSLVVMAILAGKLHHEYYWLFLAPPVAFGIGVALDRMTNHASRFAAFSGLALLCVIQVRSTWQMPADWIGLESAARTVATVVPPQTWAASSEALLYQADRRGCRMEWTAPAARRAAGEWPGKRALSANSANVGQPFQADVRLESLTYNGVRLESPTCNGATSAVPRSDDVENPMKLLEFYRGRGARYFADLGNVRHDAMRMALHDFVRRRYKVIVDCPEVIIADLADSETRPHAN
jgi:hypothetical protein